jgi:lysyl-tRNA synthetase, class II
MTEIAAGTQETEILRQRIDKLRRLREEEGYNPFENEKWNVDHTVAQVRKDFDYLKAEEAVPEAKFSMAGRLMTLRRQGKAAFVNMQDETGTIQLYFRYDTLGEKDYTFFKKWLDSGDIIVNSGLCVRSMPSLRKSLLISYTRPIMPTTSRFR